jgi:DNA polymerase-1
MKLEKALATSLKGIKREVDPNGRLHPAFNLHLVTTYRSSSDSPNFQNIPIRDPELGKLVRRCFIPSRGNRLVEIDYGGIEVKVAACYHKDPMMIRYLNNPEMDMHRDMAAQCYKLPKEEVDKLVRYCGKNMFVFPEFYGSYYVDCARHLWQAIQQMSLKTVSGVPLDKWLRRKGIDRLGHCNPELEPEHGTFELHIKEVEKNFWNNRFPVYRDWKKKWWGSYCDKGYYKTLTGFICSGVMNRKEVINYPVQGSAFHCLLWSLIRLQEFIEREGLETMLVGQIHDSIIADVPPSEFDYFIENAKRIMTKKITKHWKWINVPLEVEADACEVGETWFDKKPVKI